MSESNDANTSGNDFKQKNLQGNWMLCILTVIAIVLKFHTDKPSRFGNSLHGFHSKPISNIHVIAINHSKSTWKFTILQLIDVITQLQNSVLTKPKIPVIAHLLGDFNVDLMHATT